MPSEITTLNEALKFLAEHVNKHGGVMSASEASINIPLKPGEQILVGKLKPNGQMEVLYPIMLQRTVPFGRYYVVAGLLKLETPEIAS